MALAGRRDAGAAPRRFEFLLLQGSVMRGGFRICRADDDTRSSPICSTASSGSSALSLGESGRRIPVPCSSAPTCWPC